MSYYLSTLSYYQIKEKTLKLCKFPSIKIIKTGLSFKIVIIDFVEAVMNYDFL